MHDTFKTHKTLYIYIIYIYIYIYILYMRVQASLLNTYSYVITRTNCLNIFP